MIIKIISNIIQFTYDPTHTSCHIFPICYLSSVHLLTTNISLNSFDTSGFYFIIIFTRLNIRVKNSHLKIQGHFLEAYYISESILN